MNSFPVRGMRGDVQRQRTLKGGEFVQLVVSGTNSLKKLFMKASEEFLFS